MKSKNLRFYDRWKVNYKHLFLFLQNKKRKKKQFKEKETRRDAINWI